MTRSKRTAPIDQHQKSKSKKTSSKKEVRIPTAKNKERKEQVLAKNKI